jgi:hypothetical protein
MLLQYLSIHDIIIIDKIGLDLSEGKEMENIDIVLNAITTVGFPIVMCVILLWYIYKSQKNHKEEVTHLTEAIQNNTVVMEKILIKIGG